MTRQLKKISSLISIAPRFSRSLNVERDKDVDAIDGYILTSRAIDVIQRIAEGLIDSKHGRSFSLTGPHGGGKSSLAVFIDALSSVGPRFEKAIQMLEEADSELAKKWISATQVVDKKSKGAFSAFVTAEREPVTSTVIRAIAAALGEDKIPEGWYESDSRVTGKEIIDFLRTNLQGRWMVLVVDEFGKNLEYFSEDPQASDLYLLQMLAESSLGGDSLPLVLVTLQHLSFDEYVQGLAANQRREWIKVQGRFQDIAYIESDVQSARLMSKAIQINSKSLKSKVDLWIDENRSSLAAIGYGENNRLGSEIAYPLHPASQAILPALCSRYGQNERTLFSFLAGSEPNALPSLLQANEWDDSQDLFWITLPQIYDYFLTSAASAIGASQRASRFLEIEARIRDAAGAPNEIQSILKTIGLLNLISAGGALRASRDMLEFSLVGGSLQFQNVSQLDQALEQLETQGLITFRDFADEFRIWQGSDFDLRGQVENASNSLANTGLAPLLTEYFEFQPIVAARHSQETGTFRAFSRSFAESGAELNGEILVDSDLDGHLFLTIGKSLPALSAGSLDARPLAAALLSFPNKFTNEVKEASALRAAVITATQSGADWVALRELKERSAAAEVIVFKGLEKALKSITEIVDLKSGESYSTRAGLSTGISAICDGAYSLSPIIRNEMISKRNLSMQGAKARRVLLENLLTSSKEFSFGLDGYGPDRAIYESIFRVPGMHVQNGSKYELSKPSEPKWANLWDEIRHEIETSTRRRSVTGIQSKFLTAPFGIREGVFSLVFMSILHLHRDEFALFEHGSLVVKMDDAILERFLKNPHFFSVKYLGVSEGTRAEVFAALCKRFKLKKSDGTQPTFLAAMKSVFRELATLPPTTVSSQNLDPFVLKVRDTFLKASELDELLFVELPVALGLRRIDVDSKLSEKQITDFIEQIAKSIRALKNDFQGLMDRFGVELGSSFGVAGDLSAMRETLASQATLLLPSIKDGELKSLAPAIVRVHLDDAGWLENLGLIITGGQPPKHWTDKDRELAFEEIVRLGGAFRRLRSLHFASSGTSQKGVVTKRFTLTSSDGSEISEIVEVRENDLSVARDSIDELLAKVSSDVGSDEVAKQAILLILSEKLGK